MITDEAPDQDQDDQTNGESQDDQTKDESKTNQTEDESKTKETGGESGAKQTRTGNHSGTWPFVALTILALMRAFQLSITVPDTRIALGGSCREIEFRTAQPKTWYIPLPNNGAKPQLLTAFGYRLLIDGVTQVRAQPGLTFVNAPDLTSGPTSPASGIMIQPLNPSVLTLDAQPNQEVKFHSEDVVHSSMTGLAGSLTCYPSNYETGNQSFHFQPGNSIFSYAGSHRIEGSFDVRPEPTTPRQSLVLRFDAPAPKGSHLDFTWTIADPHQRLGSHYRSEKAAIRQNGTTKAIRLGTRRKAEDEVRVGTISMADFSPSRSTRVRGEVRDRLEKVKNGGLIDVELSSARNPRSPLVLTVEGLSNQGVDVSIYGFASSFYVDGYSALDTKLQLLVQNRLAPENVFDAALIFGWLGTFMLGVGTGLLKKRFEIT